MLRRMSLKAKLVTAFLVLGIFPAIILGWISFGTFAWIRGTITSDYQAQATKIADVIDRNLFERYGDVQAFGLNVVIQDKENWYKSGSSANKIASVMNQYAQAYGFYELELFVDLKGNVIAVNDQTPEGKTIDTNFVYTQNFSNEEWFKDAVAGKFYTAKDMLSGTVVEDFKVEPLLQKLYGDEGIAIGFSAPVKDASGQVIGVWKNFAKFSLVEDIIAEAYKGIAASGMKAASLSVINRDGRLLLDYDPTAAGTTVYKRNMEFIGKKNLAEEGFEPAVQLAKNEGGTGVFTEPGSDVKQVTGYTPTKGALGFIGMPWGIMVHAPEAHAFAKLYEAERHFFWVLGISIIVILFSALLLVQKIVKPVDVVIDNLMGTARNLRSASTELEEHGHSLASGSTEQAAAIQETVAAMAEMSGMIAQTADSARASLTSAKQMGDEAETGGKIMERMVSSMESIQQANSQLQEVVNIIGEISNKTGVIHDIVFKTQLLSFNASIEAARAGQHGRGFAVVAEEVGNLAEMSGTAAKEIQGLLEASQKQVGQIVELTNSRVNDGQRVSKESLETFERIAREIKTVCSQIESITQATHEQETGVQQASTAMTQMDAVAQKNSSLSTGTSNSAQHLASQSRYLDEVIDDLAATVHGAGKDMHAPKSVKKDAGALSKQHSKAKSAPVKSSKQEASTEVPEASRPRKAQRAPKHSGMKKLGGPDVSADDPSFRPMV